MVDAAITGLADEEDLADEELTPDQFEKYKLSVQNATNNYIEEKVGANEVITTYYTGLPRTKYENHADIIATIRDGTRFSNFIGNFEQFSYHLVL